MAVTCSAWKTRGECAAVSALRAAACPNAKGSKYVTSAQELAIPAPLKDLYKTVWEIKQRVLVDMAADRGAFIDQSQSFNVHMSDPNFGKLTSLHFYAWKARRPDAHRYL